MNKFKLIVFSILFSSCYTKEKENFTDNQKSNNTNFKNMQKMIFENGDVRLYHNISASDGDCMSNLYSYSTVMAYKFNYIPAFHNCYIHFVRLNSPNNYFNPSFVKKMNISEQKLIIFHLNNGAKLKDYGCMTSLYYLNYYKLLNDKYTLNLDSLKKEILRIDSDFKVPVSLDSIIKNGNKNKIKK